MTKKKGKTVTIRKKGRKPIQFKRGALHRALGVPENQPIPAGKKNAALAGKYGPKVKRMATLAFKGALAAGRKTVAKPKKGSSSTTKRRQTSTKRKRTPAKRTRTTR